MQVYSIPESSTISKLVYGKSYLNSYSPEDNERMNEMSIVAF